ncbi:DUF6246 family protein [Pseudescherichia sp.]|uniref:DUF6246 family protein n=1 Tax=Pseudescherichia sp. TaxID=2055881 RepID=UPI0028A1ED9A|nr:DUF6246 family protein [Pseudescherichia sp.]
MQVITDIGQAVIRAGGREIFLNPSFLAMSRIGAPEEIVRLFVTVHAGHYPTHRISEPAIMRDVLARCFAEMAAAAARVVTACCTENISQLIGVYIITAKGKLSYRPGRLAVHDVIELARHLIRHGVMGDQPPEQLKGRNNEYSNKFDARSFVYTAVAHLGMSEADAWNMTMTSFRAAMNAKFPTQEKDKIPTEEAYDEVMDWADKMVEIDRQRNSH